MTAMSAFDVLHAALAEVGVEARPAGSPTRARTTMTPDLDPRVLWRAAMLSRQFDGRPQLELDEWVDLQDAWVADHLRRRLQAS